MNETELLDRIKKCRDEIISIEYTIAPLETKLSMLRHSLEENMYELRKVCQHIDRVSDAQYTPGGYDYVSQTTYTVKCTCCNKVLGTRTVNGSYQ